jgi:two-component system, cell cycle sensor histidine kinase and response regulator CckA
VPDEIRKTGSLEESSATPENPQPATDRRSALQGTETVLLVEDDAGLLHLICKVLQHYGYSVLPAQNAQDALTIDERHAGPIHLLISDLIMPGLNGPGLAQRIVARRPAIRVLFISGYANNETVDRLASGGHTSFLPKPFTPETLARSVRQCVDRPAIRRG